MKDDIAIATFKKFVTERLKDNVDGIVVGVIMFG